MRLFFAMLLCLCCLALSDAGAQCGDRLFGKYQRLQDLFKDYHYTGGEVGEDFTRRMTYQLLDDLDPDRLLFLNAEVNQILAGSGALMDESKVCTYYNQLVFFYDRACERAMIHIERHTAEPFTFLEAETYEHRYLDRLDFCVTKEELNERWRQKLKFRTGLRLVQAMDSLRLVSDGTYEEGDEEDARFYARSRLLCHLGPGTEDSEKRDRYLTNHLLDAFAQTWDPHSNYFSKRMLDVFNARLSSEEFSFGLKLKKNRGDELVIASVMPGGPAWKTNQLHEGDRVMEILTMEGDLLKDYCLEPEDIADKLTFNKRSKISIGVQKVNGTYKKVELLNDVMDVAENNMKSYVVAGPQKLGYIALPGFYTEWNGSGMLGCANDVAREIIQLKRESIEGLILDLRFNGGGSLDEAMELAGIFIDEGSFCFVSDGKEEPYALKDPNRGLVYDGPLILMVNEMSASAAELTAAVLQNYNRAVIVGSKTYGKATGQVVLPLDLQTGSRLIGGLDSSLGFTKLTTGLFHNIDGKTYQAKGVQPDVVFPELYGRFFHREGWYETALNPVPFEKVFDFEPMPELPVSELRSKFETRHQSDERLADIQVKVDYLSERFYATGAYSLLWKDLVDLDAGIDSASLQLQEILKLENTEWSFGHHASDAAILDFDEAGRASEEVVMRDLSEDLYLYEACLVLSDLITISQ